MRRRFAKREPYVAPPGSPPLSEVVRMLGEKTQRLNQLDTGISDKIKEIEAKLRAMGFERVVSVKLPDGSTLGWSRDRRRRKDHWRFVIVSEDDAWELQSCSREERVEVFTCGAMERLLNQIQQERRVSR